MKNPFRTKKAFPMKSNEKHIPLRKCISCSKMHEKSELLRIVLPKDGEARLDIKGNLPGRGCYVCKSEECILLAEKQHRAARAFKKNISREIYNSLKEYINER